jgi:hypothetical protein
MINPEIRRLHMLKRAHAKSKVKKTKKKVNAGMYLLHADIDFLAFVHDSIFTSTPVLTYSHFISGLRFLTLV